MKKISLAVALFAALLISGCATVGNHRLSSMETSTANQTIVIGKSVKKDVTELLGDPDTEVAAKGETLERWTYMSSRAVPQGSNFIPFVGLFYSAHNVTVKTVVVDFDNQGTVKDFAAKEKLSRVTGGIFG